MGTDGEWSSILQRPLFSRAAGETSATLAHLSAIFVERHHLVWKVRPHGPPLCVLHSHAGADPCRNALNNRWDENFGLLPEA